MSSITESEFIRAAADAGACSVLSDLLCTPLEAGAITAFRQGLFLDSLEEYLGVLGVEAEEQVAVVRSVLHDSAVEEVTLVLNVEATRLFSVGLDAVPAPPYESAWRDSGRRLAGRTTMDVAQVYREAGVAVNEESGNLLPDHVARELEFLGYATRQRALALRAGDSMAAEHWNVIAERFRADHLAQWLPAWSEAVGENGTSPFFTALAEIASLFVSARPNGEARPGASQ